MVTDNMRASENSVGGIFADYQVSSSWHYAFLSRNPDLKLETATPLESLRHNNATVPNISSWFNDVLRPLYEKNNYPSHMVANCDETMVQMNTKSRMKVIVPRLHGFKRFLEMPGLTHITFVCAAFANGAAAPSLIIYPFKNLPKEVTLESLIDDPEFLVTGRAGGWISTEIFEWYCKNVIIPQFNRVRMDKHYTGRGLFILDGHSSRWNASLMTEFNQNEIDVVTLVSHTSHVCQPLDALIFGSFKRGIRTHLRTSIKNALQYQDEVAIFADQQEVDSDEDTDDEDAISMGAVAGDMISEDENVVDTEDASTGAAAPRKSQFGDLNSAQKRYCLVETAKMALHTAMHRATIRKSFEITGIFPLNLERALGREGVREGPSMELFARNIAISKKRKRVSINGRHLNSEESVAMLQSIKDAKAANSTKGKPVRKRKITEI